LVFLRLLQNEQISIPLEPLWRENEKGLFLLPRLQYTFLVKPRGEVAERLKAAVC